MMILIIWISCNSPKDIIKPTKKKSFYVFTHTHLYRYAWDWDSNSLHIYINLFNLHTQNITQQESQYNSHSHTLAHWHTHKRTHYTLDIYYTHLCIKLMKHEAQESTYYMWIKRTSYLLKENTISRRHPGHRFIANKQTIFGRNMRNEFYANAIRY